VPLRRTADNALRAHVALSAFSAVAFGTFLVPPVPAFFTQPPNDVAMRVGSQFGGQITVVLGAIAGFAFLAHAVGTRPALRALAVCFVLSLGAEALGAATDIPFGPYDYTTRLGFLIGGLVPFNIPTSWFYMAVAALGIGARFLPARDDGPTRWWWAFVTALILTSYDLVMDPAMFRTEHWLWAVPETAALRPWQQLLLFDGYYGIPVVNFLGWILTGTLVARAIVAVIPPTTWAAVVAPSRFPAVLYAANGVLPIVICLRWGMAPAAVVGIVAMGVPLALAARGRRSPA
jgi:putative membrane protein